MIRMNVNILHQHQIELESTLDQAEQKASCLKRFLEFALYADTTCLGCITTELNDEFNKVKAKQDDDMFQKIMSLTEIALGLWIHFKGEIDFDQQIVVDFEEIVDAYAHDDEDEDEAKTETKAEAEEKPDLSDDKAASRFLH